MYCITLYKIFKSVIEKCKNREKVDEIFQIYLNQDTIKEQEKYFELNELLKSQVSFWLASLLT